jgi:hypothetical protein
MMSPGKEKEIRKEGLFTLPQTLWKDEPLIFLQVQRAYRQHQEHRRYSFYVRAKPKIDANPYKNRLYPMMRSSRSRRRDKRHRFSIHRLSSIVGLSILLFLALILCRIDVEELSEPSLRIGKKTMLPLQLYS